MDFAVKNATSGGLLCICGCNSYRNAILVAQTSAPLEQCTDDSRRQDRKTVGDH